jgi:hypothetical protein
MLWIMSFPKLIPPKGKGLWQGIYKQSHKFHKPLPPTFHTIWATQLCLDTVVPIDQWEHAQPTGCKDPFIQEWLEEWKPLVSAEQKWKIEIDLPWLQPKYSTNLCTTNDKWPVSQWQWKYTMSKRENVCYLTNLPWPVVRNFISTLPLWTLIRSFRILELKF